MRAGPSRGSRIVRGRRGRRDDDHGELHSRPRSRPLSIAAAFLAAAAAGSLPVACRGWSADGAAPKAPALRAEWREIPPSRAPRIRPPRSGHASFVIDEEGRPPVVYAFGGYAEDPATKERRAVNDLWRWRSPAAPLAESSDDSVAGGGWSLVRVGEGEDEEQQLPRPRLVSAAAVLGRRAYLVGGWDPGTPGTGGDILSSCHRLDLDRIEPNSDEASSSSSPPPAPAWMRLADFPDGPTSRHVAVAVEVAEGDGGTPPRRRKLIVVHNHRCDDHVWTLSEGEEEFRRQATSGTAPSSRGLHAATAAAGGSKLVVFGGAAKDGQMSNEAFALDASTWTWSRVGGGGDSAAPAPRPRAAPCLAGFDDGTVILYGGAEATPQGLRPLGDVWALDLASGTWQLLLPDGQSSSSSSSGASGNSGPSPPPRNAATLSCVASSPRGAPEDGGPRWREYLLAGGWHPFVETRDDCYVLRVSSSGRRQ